MNKIQKPLTVVLGFLDAQAKHVDKYSQMARKLKYNVTPLMDKSGITVTTDSDVVSFTPKIENFFTDRGDLANGRDVLDVIYDGLENNTPFDLPTNSNITSRPLIFYLLSNNGAFAYANLLTYLKCVDPFAFVMLQKQTAGLIYDSAPCFPYPELFTRGIEVTKNHSFTPLPSKDHPDYAAMHLEYTKMFKTSERVAFQERLQYSLDHNLPAHVPHMHIVSAADDIVLKDEIITQTSNFITSSKKTLDVALQNPDSHDDTLREQAIRQIINEDKDNVPNYLDFSRRMSLQAPEDIAMLSQAQRLADNVHVYDFVDTPHVSHLRDQPAKYSELYQSFVNYALRK